MANLGPRLSRALLASGLAVFLGLNLRGAGPDPRRPGTLKMAALLERLAQQSNPMGNLFLSRERASAMRAAIKANPAMTNSPETLYNFGNELLNAGENENALGVFARVEELSRVANSWKGQNEINVRLNQAL